MKRLELFIFGVLVGLLTLVVACETDDDDDSGDDDTGDPAGLTIRGTVHDLADFSEVNDDLMLVIADPAQMLTSGEDPVVLGSATPAADGTFEVTGVDATDASFGLIMIVDGIGDSASAYRSAATGIHINDYEGWTDGTVVEDQVAFAVKTDYVADMEADLTTAGWDGSDLFQTGAMMGFVQLDNLDPIAAATVDSMGGDIYYADGDAAGSGMFDDGAGAPNGATTVEGNGLWVSPGGMVASWGCEADGYTFEPIFVGSTTEILVIIAFRPEE